MTFFSFIKFVFMNSKKIEERMARWLAKINSHPFSKREEDLVLLLNKDKVAWERYGKFYDGWTFEEIEQLLNAVREAK
jgi:hypothetical protein|tara:strand:+ start:28 stop:261 length:234 start_codon:yes stop_codon:yes gene_type:complete